LKKIQRQEWPVDLLISKNGEWILENLTDKDHIRGALKQTCFKQMGGLKAAMGWDTVDELLSTFMDVVTD
jgi:hypothetical protein